MVEVKSEEILGYTGLDDNFAKDGVSLIFSKDKFEDEVFKGMFVIMENESDKFLGQILAEPKSIPVTGRIDNPLNEYPILHQDTVKYIPDYKIVSQVRILGQIIDNRVRANFSRPKPASKVYRTSESLIDNLFHVGEGATLGRLIGYDKSWISVSFDDNVARKQLGIFGTTGSGKSNTTLRIAEMYAEMGWCIILLDYLGEYIDCRNKSSEIHLFKDERWNKLKITPMGNEKVEVFAPVKDFESRCDSRFFLRTMDVHSEVVYNLVAPREEAQKRKLSVILQRMRRIGVPYHLAMIKDACYYSYQDPKAPPASKSSYYVMYERIKSLIDKSIWDRYVPSQSLRQKVKAEFNRGEEDTEEYEDEPEVLLTSSNLNHDDDVSDLTGIKGKKETYSYGEEGRLDIKKLLVNGKINVFNFKNSTEDDYRSTTLFILSELFRLKKEKAEKITDLPKVLIMIEEAHIPFSNETDNYLSNILMETAKKVFKIGRHYYLNMCIITQRPTDCDLALLSQVNTRIIHKLKTHDDINRVVVGDIEEFKSSIPRLSVGEAMIDCSEWITPLYIQVAPSRSKKIDINYE
jgi:uncharacterized protein